MSSKMTRLALSALALPLVTACATKGYVRDQITVARTEIDSTTDAKLAAERAERIAADEALRSDIQALRGAMESLRNEFNVRITQVEEGMQFAMPVNFAFDDASVRAQDRPVIQRFAQVVRTYYPNSKVTVEGFTDPAGSRAYNANLSLRRAEAVRQELIASGLPGGLVGSVGYGQTRQVVPGAQRDAPGAEKNRRVTFVIEGTDLAAIGIVAERSEF
jgi:peptidoglycan-associated lipoprotein